MKTFRRITAALLACVMLFSLAACNGNTEDTPSETTTNAVREVKTKVAALNGPTGLGLAKLAADRSYAYDVEFYSDPQEVAPLLSTGAVDIAALPINLASNLYKKTNGGIQILAINTLGVLYVLAKDVSITSVSDLKGKTIYATGQGSNPEYILNYILTENGLDPATDVDIQYKTAHTELATLAIEGSVDICMLPEPFVSKVLMQNKDFHQALNLTTEWDKVSDAGLAQGCIVARTEYIRENPEIIKEFLTFNEVSINYLNENVETASVFLAENKYFESAEMAYSALPGCNIIFIDGAAMKSMASKVLEILHKANPVSVGGEVPDDNFYYNA